MDNTNTLTFDFIIVGAGSAGSVMASKLSEDGRYTVLVLEQGKQDNSLLMRMPKGFGAALAGTKYVSRYNVTGQNDELTSEVWLRGKTLGGSSSVNGMIWARPQPEAFTTLVEAGGDAWSWQKMQPYLDALDGGNTNDGIIPTSTHRHQYPISQAFINAAVMADLPRHNLMTDVGQYGVSYLHYNIDTKGRRFSAATAFLKPLADQANIVIKTNHQVEKVLFNDKRANAVICRSNGKQITYTAKHEIILCAGALESPQILQRSGIGPEPLLNKLGINVIHSNANVGSNLREHLLLSMNFEVKTWADTENNQYSGIRLLWNVLRYGLSGTGPMSQSPCHAAAFMRSEPHLKQPDIQLMFSPFSRDGNDFSTAPGISIVGYPIYPKSTGQIHIRSINPDTPAQIKPNYLSHEYDKKMTISVLRSIREIASQSPLTERLVQQTPQTAIQTDEEVLELYKKSGQPGYHATGTCAMGHDIDSAVVDGNTRVHGVDGLRVVDCSIYPQMLSGVTNASVMAIAMRAADLILEEYHA